MFKFLGNKLFGAKKQDENKPKHRLTISIPSTKYDPPPKHTSKTKSSRNIKNISKLKSRSRSKSSKSRHHNCKCKTAVRSNIKIQPLSAIQNGKKAQSSSALHSPFRPTAIDPSRPIFQQSGIFHTNSSLKFEITVQYQQQMWTVYKTLCDFIELYNKLKTKYAALQAIDETIHRHSYDNDDGKSQHTPPLPSRTPLPPKTEVPPLLPLGLFYLYFKEPPTNAHSKPQFKSKSNPKHVYKQIYHYHEQQLMVQKRQEEQHMVQMQHIHHIRQMRMQEEQQQLQQQNLNLIPISSSFDENKNNKLAMQPLVANKSAPAPIPFHMRAMEPSLVTSKMNRSVFDSESPFLKHMRVSLQIWLRVVVEDAMLMISPELSSFIQFRWIYRKDKAKSESDIKSHIIGGMHDRQHYLQGSYYNGITTHEESHFNMIKSMGSEHDEDDEQQKPTLSDFTLLKVVGKGAFGKVLQVRRVDNDKIYAMKILKKENVIKRNQIEHTKTERRVLGFVCHPFIVKLYYAFQTETKLFLVLDYCGGGELFFHLGKAGRFKEDRARFYAASIALALEYLHSKDIIYRDLKPENVLLDNEGHIKLTDFGLSKENIRDNNLAHSFCGTPEYLAPEILRRCGHGKPADWWSLGALLYEMLTGMPPFYSRDRDRLFEKILHSKLRFPNYFSDAAVNILTLLMQRNWKKRLGSYQSSNPNKYNHDPKKKSFAHLKGAQQIKRHVFFKSIDWKLLEKRKLKPPFVPKLNSDQTNNFDAEFTEMPIYSMDSNSKPQSNTNSKRYIHREKRKYLLQFHSFTYIRNEQHSLMLNESPSFSSSSHFECQHCNTTTDSSSQSERSHSHSYDDDDEDNQENDYEDEEDDEGFEVYH